MSLAPGELTLQQAAVNAFVAKPDQADLASHYPWADTENQMEKSFISFFTHRSV